jgi:predicted ATP-grasp superfamily ATP-dependent carboligase
VAKTRTVKTAEELRDAVEALGLPSIAKASDSTSLLLGKKCVFIRTDLDLDSLVDNWPAGQADIIVQNEIRGRRHNCDIVAENGQIRLYFESEILRTDQADYAGNSVFDRSIPPTPVHREYCERLVAELNFTGLALIQFLRDEDAGKSYFLEANPRAGSTIGLAVNCGIDLPAASVRAHLGNLSDTDKSYPFNRSQNWLHGDLLGLRKARMNGEIDLGQSLGWLTRALADFLRSDYHTTFVWKDPLPTMTLYWNLLIRLFIKEKRGAAG